MKTAILAAVLAFAAPAADAGTWTTKWTGPHGGVYQGGAKLSVRWRKDFKDKPKK